MTYIRKEELTLTTTTTSTATADTPPLTGYLHQIQHLTGTTNFTTAATLTVTVKESSRIVLNNTAFDGSAAQDIFPRSPIHNTAGTTIAGDAPFALVDNILTVTVDSAGANRNGKFRIFVS